MALRLHRLAPSVVPPIRSTTATISRPFANYRPIPLHNFASTATRHQVRTMASSAQSEWLVVVPDKPNTLAKRLEVRPTHFANLKAIVDSGRVKFGGAVLEDVPSDPNDPKTFAFSGSTIIVLADKRSDVVDFLNEDVYAKEGVWDVDNAQIWALKTAFRFP